jgi:hypothetical protein
MFCVFILSTLEESYQNLSSFFLRKIGFYKREKGRKQARVQVRLELIKARKKKIYAIAGWLCENSISK